MSFWASDALKKAEEANTGGFDPIPEAIYTAVITDCEMKDTKSGGKRISVRFDITGPEYAGRVLFDSINVQHPNPEVVGIGLGQIKTLCTLAGAKGEKYYEALKAVRNWEEAEAQLSQLHSVVGNLPAEIRVVVEQSDTYGPSNKIKRIKPAAAAAPAAISKAKSKNPWE